MTVTFELISSPEPKFHFKKLGIDPKIKFRLNSSLGDFDRPFEKGSIATVFHVQEVVRIALLDMGLTEREGIPMAHSNKIKYEFEKLSYHASSVWNDWQEAVKEAGGVISKILQKMFGVRLGEGGWWIPHTNNDHIEVGKNWSLLDSVITVQKLLDIVPSNEIWICGETGLRLVWQGSLPESASATLSDLLGRGHRFSSPSSWLSWCMKNGTPRDLPKDQGEAYYYTGIIDDGVPRYYRSRVRNYGPLESDWWFKDPTSLDVPKLAINDGSWVLGLLWDYDDDHSNWVPSYPHFREIETGQCIDISFSGLNLTIDQDEDIEGNSDIGPLDTVRAISQQLIVDHLRAVRTLMIELGFARAPDREDPKIGGLGLGWSKVQSPFSDIHIHEVVKGSPVEKIVRSEILEINWY